VVLRVGYGNEHFLFTGDIGTATEDTLLAQGVPLAAAVLKVAHHGSRYSSSAAFLAAVDPDFAVISGGAGVLPHMKRDFPSGPVRGIVWRYKEEARPKRSKEPSAPRCR
jgi:hypothetical protein